MRQHSPKNKRAGRGWLYMTVLWTVAAFATALVWITRPAETTRSAFASSQQPILSPVNEPPPTAIPYPSQTVVSVSSQTHTPPLVTTTEPPPGNTRKALAIPGDSPLATVSASPIQAVLMDLAQQAPSPSRRDHAVNTIRQHMHVRQTQGRLRAESLGLPLRLERPDGTVKEVAAIGHHGYPIYYITHNAVAAISSGAAELNAMPYTLTGEGITIGMWDGGGARVTHQEFTSNRIMIKDGASSINHATHVGGTLVAGGLQQQAKGMAYEARVDSYDWNNDIAEMTARGAAAPGDTDALYISNHSYGYITGWYATGLASPAYIWFGGGTGSQTTDPEFGRYNIYTSETDALAYAKPYYLMFRSAGNDRTDNPSPGQLVRLSPETSTTVAYDPNQHPPGDGVYLNGYGTISFDAVAKNVITIGSIGNAISGGNQRDPSQAVMSSYSSWGPTDDGRIKPDLVARGSNVYSPINTSDTSYSTYSGTSMAAPTAAGTAALLLQEYDRLFPGEAMRSASLKGLLIHTADDLGTPGPNYRYGWGLINGVAAVDLIRDHADHPQKMRITEISLQPGDSPISIPFFWDGSSPIRATLSWTDPPGTATASVNLRSPRLRHNLDLHITGPNGNRYLPYVMPFVGDWSTAALDAPATTGTNNTDNVEQVYIANPGVGGLYHAVVSYQGTLAHGEQAFSLFISGSANVAAPPPTLTLQSVAPNRALLNSIVQLKLSGLALSGVNAIRLERAGFPPRVASEFEVVSDSTVHATFDLTGAAVGFWNVIAQSATQTSILPGAFEISESLWNENFDGQISGWASDNEGAPNAWYITDQNVLSPPRAVFSAGQGNKHLTRLTSPAIAIPGNATGLQLRFWHYYQLQNRRDGGRLELSINGGPWLSIDDPGSGATFGGNGYNNTILATGQLHQRSAFAGLAAWTGNSGGFIESIVNIEDQAGAAGGTLRFRWIIATDASVPSVGWAVDDIALLQDSAPGNTPPVITSPIAVDGAQTIIENDITYQVIRQATASLQVAADDDQGAELLTYTWTSVGPAPVFFHPNGTLAAASANAEFDAAGDYTLRVTVTDQGGLSVSDQVELRVEASPQTVLVSPPAVTLNVGDTQAFSANVHDQFSNPILPQPGGITWSTSSGGVISEAGLFTAQLPGENQPVIAQFYHAPEDNHISGLALVTVLGTPPLNPFWVQRLASEGETNLVLGVQPQAMYEYQLQFKDSLDAHLAEPWISTGSWKVGESEPWIEFTIPGSDTTRRFFRVQARPTE